MEEPLDERAGNVVLTGFMGTGKTTVARIVAQRLGLELVDTDALIESRHGPIADIFATRGEEAFREMERAVARELSTRNGLVISTGGRMMLDPANVEALAPRATVICLAASPQVILERVTAGAGGLTRPLLAGPDPLGRIVDLLEERAAGYGRFTRVDTDGRSPDEVAEEVVRIHLERNS